MSETTEFRTSYYAQGYARASLANISVALKCYRGAAKNPQWRDVDAGGYRWVRGTNIAHADFAPDMYSTLCYIEADTSQISRMLQARRSSGAGKLYYTIEYDVILLFGLTELKAQVAWQEQVR